jgi:predicted aspartyl protease
VSWTPGTTHHPSLTRRALLGAASATLLRSPADATPGTTCTVRALTTVNVTIARGLVVAAVEIDGAQGSFVLDTGAARSVVTEDAVRRLGLTRDPWVGTTMSGIGGITRRPNVVTKSLTLGGVPLVRPTLHGDTSLTVADIPSTSTPGPPIDGLLGRDYLSVFDLDLEIPARRLSLYQVAACHGRFLPWQRDYVAVPLTMPTESALMLTVEVDGVRLRALLDTGANVSLIAASGMYRLGLDQRAVAADPSVPASGVGPGVVTTQHHAFRTLKIGALTIDQPQLLVAPVRLAPIADVLLGVDWMISRRVWISYATRQLFIG